MAAPAPYMVEKITYADFAKLDLRVARLESARPIPGKSRIMAGIVDMGGQSREVIIGGAEHYTPKDLEGRTVVIVANLEPKKIGGIESSIMLLAADVDGKPHWLSVDDAVPPGSPVR